MPPFFRLPASARACCLLGLWWAGALALRAQAPEGAVYRALAPGGASNLRLALFRPAGDTLRVDTLSLVAGSLRAWRAADGTVPSAEGLERLWAPGPQTPTGWTPWPEGQGWRADPVTGTVVLDPGPRPQALWLRYRVWPLDLERRYARKDRAALDSLGVLAAPLRYEVRQPEGEGGYDLGGLDYSGSFSRGLSFGNRQDVVLNSSLNLQLSGAFRGVDVEAALTDNNIPVQPEGNTQQLQEFDQVYIRVGREGQRLTVGDYELRRPEGAYFLNLFRRLQGAQYRGRFGAAPGAPGPAGTLPLGAPASGGVGGAPGGGPPAAGTAPSPGGQLTVGASVAAARGQYRRQFLVPEEGNQGPYLLRGNEGERFIIVLAGSERVYVDGELLTRGQDYDYVIDYNAGELTFTPRRIVTKDLRIQVEFEYAERAYFRSLFLTDGQWEAAGGKGAVRWSFYSEQDARNQPVDATVGDRERDALRAAGDSLDRALAPAFDTASFAAGQIRYRLVDTLGFDSVFRYTTVDTGQLYAVSFALVGAGKGDYVLAQSLANGRVYEWVAPVAGVPQGDYAPVRRVPAPLSRQILSVGGTWRPLAGGEVYAEGSLSRLDVNTVSDRDDADDAGLAGVAGFRQELRLGGDSAASTLVLDARYEWTSARFRPLENYRPIEFSRDWNLGLFPSGQDRREERWLTSGLAWRGRPGRRAGLRLDRFRRGPGGADYDGWRPSGELAWAQGGFRGTVSGSYLTARQDSAASSFWKQRLDLTQRLGGPWSARLYGEIDDVRFRAPGSDSLTAATIYYDLVQVRVARDDSAANRYGVTYRLRRDKGPRGEDLALSAVANELIVDGGLRPAPGQRIDWTLTARDLNVLDTALIPAEAERALLGRVSYGFGALRGLVSGDLLYELGTASEPRRNLAYVPVPDGQGQYVWNDYNDNGVQELDEFELAVFQDQADFIRVFTPTDEFVRADVLGAQYSLGLQPKARWPSAEGPGGFFTRFSAQSIAQFNRRVLEGSGAAAYWPLAGEVPDSSLVSLTALTRNTIWFNRSRPDFGLEYTFSANRGRNLLNGGPEDRRTRTHEAVLRAALGRLLNLRLEARAGRRDLDSEAFATRSYALPFTELEPRLNLQAGTVWRAGLRYGFGRSRNRLGAETLTRHEAGLEGRWNRVGRSSLDASASVVLVDYAGAADSPVAFTMLEGLQDGTNWLWQLNWDRRLSRFLQLSLQYEGRKTGAVPIAHVGRAQLRAIF